MLFGVFYSQIGSDYFILHVTILKSKLKRYRIILLSLVILYENKINLHLIHNRMLVHNQRPMEKKHAIFVVVPLRKRLLPIKKNLNGQFSPEYGL